MRPFSWNVEWVLCDSDNFLIRICLRLCFAHSPLPFLPLPLSLATALSFHFSLSTRWLREQKRRRRWHNNKGRGEGITTTGFTTQHKKRIQWSFDCRSLLKCDPKKCFLSFLFEPEFIKQIQSIEWLLDFKSFTIDTWYNIHPKKSHCGFRSKTKTKQKTADAPVHGCVREEEAENRRVLPARAWAQGTLYLYLNVYAMDTGFRSVCVRALVLSFCFCTHFLQMLFWSALKFTHPQRIDHRSKTGDTHIFKQTKA